MFPVQPTGLRHYLTRKSLITPSNLSHYFYVSWEDALWDLIKFFQISEGSVVLVPEFFCMDVIRNMEQHSLRCVWYPVNHQLQTDPKKFVAYIKKYNPKIVVIFHAVGITNQLFLHTEQWLPILSNETLVLEDAVHRTVDPQNILLFTPRHVVIDSLRKVSPIMGSNLYGDAKTLKLTPTLWQKTLPYQLAVVWWWGVFQLCLCISSIRVSEPWQRFWNACAEKAMLAGYDRIGDSALAGSGWWCFKWLARHLDVSRIRTVKQQQTARYVRQILWDSTKVFPILFSSKDAGELRGFPVGLYLSFAKSIVTRLRDAGVFVRTELDGCPWTTRHNIIYLPLGPHLSLSTIDEICATLNQVVLNTV